MAPTVLAECRPNLRACYFFIKDVPNAKNASVEVGEQTISVWISGEQLRVIVPPGLTLVPGSISGQTPTNYTLTFRTNIKSFSLAASLDERSCEFSPIFDVNESISLHCDFCHENLTDARVFSRVLPLPSSEEPSDFFCHRHSDEPLSLDPKSEDFFYNYFFYKIHLDNFRVPPINNSLECHKCLEPLGEVQGKCVKLCNSVVSFSTTESSKGDSVDKFLKSFLYFTKNLPVQMNKFVLTSSHGSFKHYTLIWIMDRTLVILENPIAADCNSVESSVYLEPKKVMKVLYSHHELLTENAEEWMKSFTCSLIPIHHRVEARLVNYLKAAADRIPEDCATVNGMSVSYIY